MSELHGKVAIVLGIGCQPNIGRGIAQRFAEAGAKLVVGGRDEAAISAAARQLDAIGVRCEITSEVDLATLVDTAISRYGRLDIAVNAVGQNLVKDTLAVTRAELEAVTSTQFFGSFFFMQAVIRGMTKGGSIIQISSVTSTALMRDHAVYMATKAAADTLVRSVAYDYGHAGIRVNALSPGATLDAPMAAFALQDPKMIDELRLGIPLRRIGTVLDIAEAALWLAGDHCFVTGENIQVNGGAALHRLQ